MDISAAQLHQLANRQQMFLNRNGAFPMTLQAYGMTLAG